MNTSSKTRIMVEGAMLIALATVLSFLKFGEMPFGGAITLEMIPLVVMGFRNGAKWGVFTGFVHGLLQMIIGFSNVMYCATLAAQIGCILLDYLLAFSVLGLGMVFAFGYKKNKVVGAVCGSVIVGALRFLCSFVSGIVLWGSYAPEGMNVALYSLIYNGSYMLADTVIVAVAMGVLAAVAPKLLISQNTEAEPATSQNQ